MNPTIATVNMVTKHHLKGSREMVLDMIEDYMSQLVLRRIEPALKADATMDVSFRERQIRTKCLKFRLAATRQFERRLGLGIWIPST